MSNILNAILNFFLAIILPVQIYLLLIGAVILLDSYYGYLKSRKDKHKFDIYLLLAGIRDKVKIYAPAIIAIYWLDEHLINEFVLTLLSIQLAATKIGCAVLISTELASVNKNIKAITGKSLQQRMKDTLKVAKDVKESSDDLLK